MIDAALCACVTPESHDTALNAMRLCQMEILHRVRSRGANEQTQDQNYADRPKRQARLSPRAQNRRQLRLDTERGQLCPMAMHVAFPYIDILRYGGHLPGQEDGTAVFCCPDVDTINVFRIEIVE